MLFFKILLTGIFKLRKVLQKEKLGLFSFSVEINELKDIRIKKGLLNFSSININDLEKYLVSLVKKKSGNYVRFGFNSKTKKDLLKYELIFLDNKIHRLDSSKRSWLKDNMSSYLNNRENKFKLPEKSKISRSRTRIKDGVI